MPSLELEHSLTSTAVSGAQVAGVLGASVRASARLVAAAICLLGAACSTFEVPPFPEPLRAPKPEAPAAADATEDIAAGVSDPQGRFTPTPKPKLSAPSLVQVDVDRLGEELDGPPIGASFNEVPLATFVNEVFGERLGLSFHIAPTLRERRDLVTLRLAEAVPPSQLFAAARGALRHYGVDIVQEEGVLTFRLSDNIEGDDVPLLISGRTLPDVPPSHRDIFQHVPLHVVSPNQLRGMLQRALPGQSLEIESDSQRNVLLLRGSRTAVAQALRLVEALDQPLMRGRHGIIIDPEYLDPSALANDLTSLLEAEGYAVDANPSSATPRAVLIFTLASTARLVAFATDVRTLARIEEWSTMLDERERDAVDEAWFTYRVRRTKAATLVPTLQAALTGRSTASQSGGSGRQATTATAGQDAPRAGEGDSRIVVDEHRNLLLFRGSGREWRQLLELIEQLDVPTPMVVVEVLVAEVSLTDQEASGVEFIAQAALEGGRGITFGTLDALGVQAKALSATIDSAGNTRALLNMFHESNRVVIRSRPRLTVLSGEAANFDGGVEIPTVTQIGDAGIQQEGSTNFLQQVSYRQTGVTISVEPTVQGDGLVDLKISQQLSEAQPTAATSLTGSPTILNRSLETVVTLRDGGSLVIGGLISDNRSAGQTRVPGLGRVPVLGRLFRTDTALRDRTELIVMVIPYVLADHHEAEELTERIRDELELHREYMADGQDADTGRR